MILINLHLSLGSRADQDVYIYKFPGGPLKPLNFHSLLEKTIILAGIYNQQFQESIILMVSDLQGLFSRPLFGKISNFNHQQVIGTDQQKPPVGNELRSDPDRFDDGPRVS